jgi:hypothetical protein
VISDNEMHVDFVGLAAVILGCIGQFSQDIGVAKNILNN